MRRRARLALIAGLALALVPTTIAGPPDPDGYLWTYVWRGQMRGFGAFSGIALGPDGSEFRVVSDNAVLILGRLRRDPDGRLRGVAPEVVEMLRTPDGSRTLRSRDNDSEGIAIAPDGSTLISFERTARVWRYARPDGPAEVIAVPPEFADMAVNGALEALAVDGRGWIYTIPEVSQRRDATAPVHRWRDGVWDMPFTLPLRNHFRPVGADVGPDGRLYVLERAFHGFGGFSSRIRRFDLAETALTGETVVIETAPGRFGDLEGVAVWRDTDGRLRATAIADDNYSYLFDTEIVEFRLPD